MDSRVILTVLLLANMVAPQLALPAQNEWDELEGLLHDQSVESKPKAMQKAEVEQDLVEVACIVYADTGERECYPLGRVIDWRCICICVCSSACYG